ncbi:YoaK family protein [Plesiomonas shigelloides]|uniref:YoaK family protein n=1 Tax=Plesiomonas shigelloides TaxID=703 RepID=UPI001C5A8CEB|nr:YoaK family protein [Plesiomonas shigelloides]MBW3792499.1 DUF1275 domain-containing protein [Plesiomonas shigelloides]
MEFPRKEPFLLEPVLLSWIAGYIDTVGFIGLSGLFTSSIIQSLIVASAPLATTLWLAVSAVVCFMLAMAVVTYSFTRQNQHSIFYKARWYMAETVLLFLFMICGHTLKAEPDSDNFWLLLTSLLGVTAMGIHCAISRLMLRHRIGTATATGNLIQLTIRLTEFFATTEPYCGQSRREEQALLWSLFWSVVSFILGITVAAYGFAQDRFLCLILPCALMLFLSYKEYTFAHINRHRSDTDMAQRDLP